MAINPLVAGLAVGGIAAALSKKKEKAPSVTLWDGVALEDKRARLIVPDSYRNLVTLAAGPHGEIFFNGGIVFPYTPAISIDRSAAWNPQSMIHSNYNFYSYKNSAVNGIRLAAKFTVQNDSDAGVYLSSVLLLNALTKMPFGTDTNAGSPPPVCRLFAYGGMMFDNVPVVVSSVNIELPETVDYYQTNKMLDGSDGAWDFFNQGSNMVPTLSSITLMLVPIYSRYEQMNFNVNDMLKGNFSNRGRTPGKGYL